MVCRYGSGSRTCTGGSKGFRLQFPDVPEWGEIGSLRVMDFSGIARRGAALSLAVLVVAGLSGCSGGLSSAAVTADAVNTAPVASVSAVGRPMVDPAQHSRAPRAAKTLPAKAARVVAVKAAAKPVERAAVKSVKADRKAAVKVVAVVKSSPAKQHVVAAPSVSKPKAVSKPATTRVKTKAKAKSAPAKPRSKPVTKPAPSKPKVVSPAFQAPTVRYAGASCRKGGAGTWTITHTWTATGGSYVDLGSAQHRLSPVTVTGGTRTWTFVTTEYGSSAPEVTDAYLGRIIAPIGRSSDIGSWRSVERQVDMVQVRC